MNEKNITNNSDPETFTAGRSFLIIRYNEPVLADSLFDQLTVEERLNIPERVLYVLSNTNTVKEGWFSYKLYLDEFNSLEENSAEFYELISAISSPRTPFDTIEIEINSPGGDVNEMFILERAIHNSFDKENISCTINQHAMSAAGLMFLGAHNRYVHEYAYLMLHGISISGSGKMNDMVSTTLFLDELYSRFIHERLSPFFSNDEIDDIKNRGDRLIDHEEMADLGVATHVILFDGSVVTAQEYIDISKKKRQLS